MNNAKKQIIINSLWMTFDKIFLLILSLLVTVKVANYFGTEQYGTYQYAISITALLEIAVNLVDGRVVKKYYLDFEPDKLVLVSTICRIFFSFISFVIGIFIVLLSNRGSLFTTVFLILLFNMILTNLRFGMSNRFEYLLKAKKIVIAADISSLISSFLQLTIINLNGTIIHLSLVATLSSIINLCILYIQYKIEFKSIKTFNFDYNLVKLLIIESLPLAIAAACAIIYHRCDSVMIGNLLTISDVGIYSISLKINNVVQIAINPIRESVYPNLIQLYKTDKLKYEKIYIKISSLLTWIFILGVSFSFIVLPYLFKYLNESYELAFPIYKIYVLGTFFVYNAALRAGHFTLINRGSILTYTQIISVVINIIFNYILIRNFGIYGAAIATTITQFVSLMISNIFFGYDGRKVFIWQLKALNPCNIFKY